MSSNNEDLNPASEERKGLAFTRDAIIDRDSKEGLRPVPAPETKTQELTRMAQVFLLCKMQASAADVIAAVTDVLCLGPNDDGDGEYRTALERLSDRYNEFNACIRYLAENGISFAYDMEHVRCTMEELRQAYQQSSGRGLLRVPVVIVKE